jgi:hypothetical protein
MAESSNTTANPNPATETKDGQTAKKEPVVIICIGMAGSVRVSQENILSMPHHSCTEIIHAPESVG